MISGTPQDVQALVRNPVVPPWNKLRLVILYALRYQKTQSHNVASLITLMLENGVSREDARVEFITPILVHSGFHGVFSWYTCS